MIVQVCNDVAVHVGALGKLTFKKGLYGYVGSAQVNLEKRVLRHLKKSKRRFWHIDYLLGNKEAQVLKVFIKQADKTEECMIARLISERAKEIAGFGASDCNCRSHLFRLKDYGFLLRFLREPNVKN